jgi:hypothetical protein
MPATKAGPTDKSRKKSEQTKKAEEKVEQAEQKKVETVEEKQEEADPAINDPMFMSPRDPNLKTAELNSAPHPELWPAPDMDPDAEKPKDAKTGIRVVPGDPSVNYEYVIKAFGLPINSGLTIKLEQPNEAETWLTHKSDPFGDAHVVWRTRHAGKVKVSVFGRDQDGDKGKQLASETFEVLHPAGDARFGEARGHA